MKTDVHNHAVPESAMELLSRDPVYGVTVDANFHVSGGPEGAYTVEPPFRDPPAKLANLERHGPGGTAGCPGSPATANRHAGSPTRWTVQLSRRAS